MNNEIKRLQQLANIKESEIDNRGNIVYDLIDADWDFSQENQVLLTWELENLNQSDLEKLNKSQTFDLDYPEDQIYTYIQIKDLKK